MNKSNGIIIKSPEEIKLMTEGGKKLAAVKGALRKEVAVGISAYDIEVLAQKLIKKAGAKPSFAMVPGYAWATCVNVNEGVVHGIPKREIIFKKKDVVSIDVGLYYKGFHTDTSFSVGLETDDKVNKFLETGKKALYEAISEAKIGNRIYDISSRISGVLKRGGYTPIRALVGHGVGRSLHEEPQIPCFVDGFKEKSPVIPEGAALAIEVMYTMGGSDVVLTNDRWTISTSDGTISGLFEETVAVTNKGPKVLTKEEG